MRLLFLINHDGFIRNIEATLHELTRRGHEVHLGLLGRRPVLMAEADSVERLCESDPLISFDGAPKGRGHRFAPLLEALCASRDYLRYQDPVYAQSQKLRSRAEEYVPGPFVPLARAPVVRSPLGRRILDRSLRDTIAGLPTDPELDAYIGRHSPDVVLFTPLVGFGLGQNGLLHSAKAAGIPTILVVHSWDNLTNKGLIHEIPERVVVWNDDQKREAVELHGVPERRIAVAGAHTYDHWFYRQPSTTREQFCAKVGLDPGCPFFLYTCSSSFIAPDEAVFVSKWLRAIRNSEAPRLREAGILIRPHPQNKQDWNRTGIEGDQRTALWPTEGVPLAGTESRDHYYDSIHHSAAVVGINTSAMIESAIQCRPVLTMLAPEFRQAQDGTLHFDYLTGDHARGPVVWSQDFDEHLRQLDDALAGRLEIKARTEAFLSRFVRPHGLHVAAAPLAAAKIEDVAAERPSPRRSPRAVTAALLAPVAALAQYGYRRQVQRGESRPRTIVRPRSPARRRRPSEAPRRLLVILDQPGRFVHFDQTFARLAERGNEVHIAFAREKSASALDAIDLSHIRVVVHRRLPKRNDRYAMALRGIRRLADYVHYLSPSLREAVWARAKWRDLAKFPRGTKWLQHRDTLPDRSTKLILTVLTALERAVPTDARIDAFVSSVDPDVVVVSPLIDARTDLADYLASARKLRIPGVLCVASWDNLSSKGLVRVLPDRVTVWNPVQAREAVEYHGIPREQIVLTGSVPHDRWIERTPSSSAPDFRRRHDLPADQAFLLFVGSSRQRRDPQAEVSYVRDWVMALRSSDDPLLRDVPILVRPHPSNAQGWIAAGAAELPGVSVWHRDEMSPIGATEAADYFDGLYHCAAVIGINTSAMVEAAIIDRPVHTVALPEWRPLQRDLLHFHYLLPERGGFLREARTFDEHLDLLGADLRDPSPASRANRCFVESFIRPLGLSQPATPVLVEALEASSTLDPAKESTALIPVSALVRTAATIASLRAGLKARASRREAPPVAPGHTAVRSVPVPSPNGSTTPMRDRDRASTERDVANG